MSAERDEAMRVQEATEDMIRMRDPTKAIRQFGGPYPGAKAMSIESTPALRDRLRELATFRDDFDRGVHMVLDDFDKLCVEHATSCVEITRLQSKLADLKAQAAGSSCCVEDDAPPCAPFESVQKELAEAQATIAKLREALEQIESALLSDSPDGGAQKDVYEDSVVYRLDGQAMYVALNAVRAALAPPATEEG